MKLLSLLITIIIAITVLYFAYINLNNDVIVMCPFQNVNFEMSLSHLILLLATGGGLAGFSFAAYNYAGKMNTLNAYKRKFEKMSVQSDCDDTKLKALETKIQTLEVALENALKNKEQ